MHESMLDECKPIVLEGGVRVDFPPPTRKVQRLRRLRTRGASRGRGAPRGSAGDLGAAADWASGAPGTFAGSYMLLPGLSSAQGGASQDMDAILASPLLAGLRRTAGTGAPTAAAQGQRRERAERPRQREAERLREAATTRAALPRKRAAWADLQDDHLDGSCSECSTRAPGSCSGALSSDGSGAASDGLAGRRRGAGGSEQQRWSGSMLAQGLLPVVLEAARPGA
ncbi:unnamed protein product [Prorocentrum cordatum]|uniref:Uncharacterized protein n=1 Tax=Prorocentrum cordatum TaxID=2364126 RepID=A0ABN9UPW6_9DINO|nr:unnamed protein product [Polarella glacialis]